ncbi:hypothetical protein [Roseivirga sp. E12]|uniref:hypothetical protein n=1 Tax=Roseivirga sp. E12 TaxID=2819237 RepID=UPI001ABCE10D|nr:hypothetical protein [Roseivirga sp. E12]
MIKSEIAPTFNLGKRLRQLVYRLAFVITVLGTPILLYFFQTQLTTVGSAIVLISCITLLAVFYIDLKYRLNSDKDLFRAPPVYPLKDILLLDHLPKLGGIDLERLTGELIKRHEKAPFWEQNRIINWVLKNAKSFTPKLLLFAISVVLYETVFSSNTIMEETQKNNESSPSLMLAISVTIIIVYAIALTTGYLNYFIIKRLNEREKERNVGQTR